MKMNWENYKSVILLLGIAYLTSSCAPKKKIELANPASVNCIETGGKIHMEKGPGGGTRGICIFSDHRQCEEWALFRRECPTGGVDIRGLSTPAGIYCALKGGKLLENETLCQLPSGKVCSAQSFYEGTCL